MEFAVVETGKTGEGKLVCNADLSRGSQAEPEFALDFPFQLRMFTPAPLGAIDCQELDTNVSFGGLVATGFVERPFLVIDIPRFAVTGHMLTGNVAWTDSEETEGVLNCEPCPRGRWTNEEGTAAADLCFNCSAGRWSSGEGAASQDCHLYDACIDCLAGRASERSGAPTFAWCEPCEAGRFSDTGAASCIPCRAGSWSGGRGATGNETSSCTHETRKPSFQV
eukprot:s4325_g2.t1